MNETLEQIQVESLFVDVIRANRLKTVGIRVDGNKVSIRVPQSLSLIEIELFIKQKKAWINKKLTQQTHKYPTKLRRYIDGEKYMLFGDEYKLNIIHSDVVGIELSGESLNLTLPEIIDNSEFRKNLIFSWYKRKAEIYLNERVVYFSPIIGRKPKQVKIKLCKTRWGSCSSLGNINFNWLIIMAPKPIIDYVVVHELCHLIEHNHSPSFWQLVGAVIPNYADCLYWLKTNINYCHIYPS